MGTHDTMYPLQTGFLIKSPPDNRVTGNFKRWMRRWFVLWEDKTLEYYKERGDARPKKIIDLSRCEFLDTNLSDRKFENIFSIRVGGERDGRTYYLAADSPFEMKTWIDKICQLCDFKPTENNNNDSTTLVRHRAQLEKEIKAESRDSGILLPESGTGDSNDTSDFGRVKVVPPMEPEIPDYDDVPPPVPVNTTNEDADNLYNVPPHHSSEKCQVDWSSSSGCSLSISDRRDSDIYRNEHESEYDVPPPPTKQSYPLTSGGFGHHSPQSNYDVPKRLSGGSGNEDGGDIYDIPPQHSNYDTPPRHPMSDMTRPVYNNIEIHNRSNVRPSSNGTPEDIYDHVPAPQPNYDIVPRSEYDYVPPPQPSYDIGPRSEYDFVPPPKPLHQDYDQEEAPPISRVGKPQTLKPYVNLQTPMDQGLDAYKKPLPKAPAQRDSGTGFDDEGGIYDIPPVPQPPGNSAPSVDRRSKPGTTPPLVNRSCKPGKGREYVNIPMRSATVKDSSYQQARRGGNVQRSKSSVADYESEGYLYMDSPQRTESSLRYSKKEASLPEEEVEYEYMSLKTDTNVYQNCDTPSSPQTTKKEPERTPPLRGHYQDISVVCSRDVPSVPQRVRTQYTTIDLQKTKGFRKTCEDAGKGQ